jgi:phage FluMu protein gp41
MSHSERVPLTSPVKIGDKEYDALFLTETTGAHIIEAQEESEKVVMTKEGPALVASPTLVGLNILRRQVSVGDLNGVDLAIIKRLSAQDLRMVQDKAEQMDNLAAIRAMEILDGLEKRGRSGEQDG